MQLQNQINVSVTEYTRSGLSDAIFGARLDACHKAPDQKKNIVAKNSGSNRGMKNLWISQVLRYGSSLSVSHHIMLISSKIQVTIENGKLDVNVNDNRPVDVLQVSISGRICNPRLSPPQEPPTLKFARVVLNALSACKINLVCKQKEYHLLKYRKILAGFINQCE